MPKLARVGRLALRHEGDSWNAYYAAPDTMEGALPLASIRMALVAGHPARKQAFMMLMRDCVGDLIRGAAGVDATWGGPQTAPEHERAGHG